MLFRLYSGPILNMSLLTPYTRYCLAEVYQERDEIQLEMADMTSEQVQATVIE